MLDQQTAYVILELLKRVTIRPDEINTYMHVTEELTKLYLNPPQVPMPRSIGDDVAKEVRAVEGPSDQS